MKGLTQALLLRGEWDYHQEMRHNFLERGLPAGLLGLLVITACASAPASEDARAASGPGEAAASAVSQTGDGLADAAMSPLEDFNLKREPIPPLLKALETPYFPAHDMSCAEIAEAVVRLDEHLGADWDAPDEEAAEEDGSRAQWAADQTADAALDAVSSEARGFIPFRGLVREATGAEAHARRIRKAYRLGAEQRAFLKGVGQAQGCLPPAAPWPQDTGQEAIVYRAHRGGD